jgi:hypothetical protein
MSEIVPNSIDSEVISVPVIESESESIDDYVTSKPVEIQRESTRTQISVWLLISFSGSIAASYIMVCVAAFLPGIDKTIITDSLPLLLTPQVTLLGVSLGFYFAKEK